MDEEKKVTGENEGQKNDRLGDLRAILSATESEGNDEAYLNAAGRTELDELTRTKRSNATLVMFLAAIVMILGVLGYAAINDQARERIVGFIRGDLFELQKERAEDLAKLYVEKMDVIAPKYGSIRLQYFPQDAKVHIIRRFFRFDDITDKEAEEWGDPVEIPNATLELKEGEQLPYLSIENLPIRDRALMCLKDGKFYPPGQGFCPGPEFDKCRASEVVVQDEAEAAAEKAEAKAEGKDPKKAKDAGPALPAECVEGALKPVQFCKVDSKFYVETTAGVMMCPDGKTPMDPSAVPIFVVQYDFVFEAKGFLPKVVTYQEANWIHLGSGKYLIPWPEDFALLRAWGPAKERFAETYRKIKCWEKDWTENWEQIKRSKALIRYNEILEEETKKTADARAPIAAIRDKYTATVAVMDAIARVKGMATLHQGLSEIFVYCPEVGKCEAPKMVELAKYMGSVNPDLSDMSPLAKAIYFGTLQAMGVKKWDGLEAYYADKPAELAGMTCVGKWMATQKEGSFVPVTDKDCLALLENVKASNETLYGALRSTFIDPSVGQALLAPYKDDVEKYLKSVDDYKGEETYENFTFRIESTGKFVEYVLLTHLFAPETVDAVLGAFTESRQVNYRRDCEKRQVVPVEYRGLKLAADVAWGTGSEIVFGRWFDRLWGVDVQGCLIFAKEHGDQARFEKYMKIYMDVILRDQNMAREAARFQKDAIPNIEKFRALREELKAANAMFKADAAGFAAKYPEANMEALKTSDPDLYLGLLLITKPADGKTMLDELAKLEVKAADGTPIGKDGDQRAWHKVLFYKEIFAPADFQAGMAALKARVETYFLTQDDYDKLIEAQPDLPAYGEVMRDIEANLLHMKYFWLLKLYESPATFEAELARIKNARQVMEVSRWLDPQRFLYLADLVWMKDVIETYDRYDALVPLMTDALMTGYPVYSYQKARLENWCKARSKVIKNGYKRTKLGDSFLREPEMVETALGKVLKSQSRMGQLFQNLADYASALQADAMGRAMDDIREEVLAAEDSSRSSHAYPNLQAIRISGGYTQQEFDSLKDELEKTAAHADWYAALVEEMKDKRWDCRTVDFPTPKDWKDFVAGEKKAGVAPEAKDEKKDEKKDAPEAKDEKKDEKKEGNKEENKEENKGSN